MKRNYRTLLVLVLTFIMTVATMPAYALESDANSVIQPIYPQAAYKELFEDAGVDVPSNAMFGPTELSVGDDLVKHVATMLVINGEQESQTMLMDYLIDNETGDQYVLDIAETMNDNTLEPLLSKGFTRGNVTATAFYNRKTDSAGYYYFQPTSCSFISTVSQNVVVVYSIFGDTYNSSLSWVNGDEAFNISISKYPATANQYYSTSKTAPYYYKPVKALSGVHVLYLTVGGTQYSLTISTPI